MKDDQSFALEQSIEEVRKIDQRALGLINHLLEDELSTNRVRQILAFLAEIMLQVGGDRLSNAITDDATEGLGWILQSCHEALDIHEEILQPLARSERTAARAEVSQLSAAD